MGNIQYIDFLPKAFLLCLLHPRSHAPGVSPLSDPLCAAIQLPRKEMHPCLTMQVALLATVCAAQLLATSAQVAPIGEAALLKFPREPLTSPGFAGLPESARAAIMAARMHSMGFAPAPAPAGALMWG